MDASAQPLAGRQTAAHTGGMIQTTPGEEDERPFVVPCARLHWRAPLGWLMSGWQDVRSAPGVSLAFGILAVGVSLLVSVLAWRIGRFGLLAAVLSGFVFLAPLLAVGLYSVPRAHERGQTPTLTGAWRLAMRVTGQASMFALVQLVILMVWSRSGMVLNAVFPVEQGQLGVLVQFFALGSAIGGLFAFITFALAAFSLPMIADRDVDMITACVSSINAVLRNTAATVFWAVLIVALTLVGFATLFVGFVVIMPWLAYAAWHGYRETLDASDWPQLE